MNRIVKFQNSTHLGRNFALRQLESESAGCTHPCTSANKCFGCSHRWLPFDAPPHAPLVVGLHGDAGQAGVVVDGG